jgi:hypothetical protein
MRYTSRTIERLVDSGYAEPGLQGREVIQGLLANFVDHSPGGLRDVSTNSIAGVYWNGEY